MSLTSEMSPAAIIAFLYVNEGDSYIDKEMAVASLQVESSYDITPTLNDGDHEAEVNTTLD